MILLAADCLLFQLSSGESVPVTAETVSVELVGSMAANIEPEMVQNATAAVFHYFKSDLFREMVSVEEFAGALEKVLRGFGFQVHGVDQGGLPGSVDTNDLCNLARATGGELHFFPELRRALRIQLGRSPRMVRFHGLRGCVKQLTGAQRWSPRCEALRDQIVDYLQQCVTAESAPAGCVLLVK